MTAVRIQDVTLRDGNHALRHKLSSEFVRAYCDIADGSASEVVEVGHGMGIGASSLLVGRASEHDLHLLEVARESLRRTKLGIHSIPGFATVAKDLKPAYEVGVDVFRIATHVTEADTSVPHIEQIRHWDREAVGVLMMSHMADLTTLIEQASTMQTAGASSVMIMDSAGKYTPVEVERRIHALVDSLTIPVGFHAHNNLGVGVANALAAAQSGAWTIDGASMGLGAGSGNAQLECIAAVFSEEFGLEIELEPFLVLSQITESYARESLPRTTSSSVVSGLSGVVSAFAPYVKAIAEELSLAESEVWRNLGSRGVVAGQESIIREIATGMLNE